MAQANKKVYVSPGVYTSETDLSFVTQSVGVTTLGLVGESLKGPAFEPVFITNYDEFQTYFGGTSPEKFVNTQIPKYEAAYIAKSYLQQSNQLFFTRILGLSGYDAGPSWSIKVIANVDPTTLGFLGAGETWSASFTGNSTANTFSLYSISSPIISNNLSTQYTKLNGDTSTMFDDIQDICVSTALDNSLASITSVFYGSVPTVDYDSVVSTFSAVTNEYDVYSPSFDLNDLSSGDNDAWYYANFTNYINDSYSGYSAYYNVTEIYTGASAFFSGQVTGTVYTLTGTAYSEYNNMVVATLRSRGISLYNSTYHGPVYQVTGLTDVIIDQSGSYAGSLSSPYEPFLLSGVTSDGDTFSFDISMAAYDTSYITKVLGTSNFGKNRNEVPLFVEESYGVALAEAYNMGYIRGISSDLIALPSARSQDTTSLGYHLEKYQSPSTPFLVSELRGNKVYKLFRFVSISDGDAANVEIKVSIANISFNNGTFDVLVRSFYDQDSNPVVLERYINCDMDPTSSNYIAKRIGTTDGEYSLVSKYIMVEMSDEAPVDALPCGFYGYRQRTYESATNVPPIPKYKIKYNYPGEVIANPPFGIANEIESSGDIVRRTYLGISSTIGIDESFLTYKGKQNPAGWVSSAVPVDGQEWSYLSRGFHMDSGATVVTIGSEYTSSGDTAFECGVASFTQDPDDQTSPYYYIYSRKFTVCFAGGFDGWDIYREHRTNQDRFQLGSSGFLAGASPSSRYPTATGEGLFKRIVVENNTQDFANTDFYAYLLGVLTFRNPESTNINVLATTGFDYFNHQKLAEETIDMVQYQRADCVYIATTPDYQMYVPDAGLSENVIYPQDAVNNLDSTGIDSNYTATYFPWILVRDTVNNTQIYLPPTGEVCKNLALTDNVAFPWFATAGYNRGLVNSIKARLKLTQEDRDTLYQGRINAIATFADVGTVIWGNRTLQVADTALNRLNVRRLLLQARKLISAVAVRLLFEQNDQIVRQQFLDSVNPILDSIRRDRGIYDFRVVVTSTPEDLDRSTLTGKIYLKPTKALEFIDIEFFVTPAGASFENI